MPLKQSSNVQLIKMSAPFDQTHLFQVIATNIQRDVPKLTAAEVRQRIMEREHEGETYIGYGVVLLHLISDAVSEGVLLIKSAIPMRWRSAYSGEDHHVDKFVVLAIAAHGDDGAKLRPIMQQLADEASTNQLFEME